MSYFLYPEIISPQSTITISGEEAKHLALSRRGRIGENVKIQDITQKRFSGVIVKIDKKSLQIKIGEEIPAPLEPKFKITIIQALISEQALDYILQKSTELGINEIIIYKADFSPKFEGSKLEKKISRWNRICVEAAKQSERTAVPKIHYRKDLEDAVNNITESVSVIGFDKTAEINISKLSLSNKNFLAYVIGPEGGLSNKEISCLVNKKAKLVKLGPRILKAETAAIASLSILQSLFGDF